VRPEASRWQWGKNKKPVAVQATGSHLQG